MCSKRKLPAAVMLRALTILVRFSRYLHERERMPYDGKVLGHTAIVVLGFLVTKYKS